MAGLQEYKCPCCGGAIAFDSTIQKMKCPYCDTEFEMDALKGYDAELQDKETDSMEWETAAGGEWGEGETDGLRTYVCKSCGGEIVGDANTAATSCPFCDNPIVMMGQFSGSLKPDLIIPFKLDKKAAKEGLMKHLTGKRLLPKIFKDQNHIDEIKGVYVPIKETIRGFKAIISGEMDDYPENAFFNVGTIDDVKRAAEKMQASVK